MRRPLIFSVRFCAGLLFALALPLLLALPAAAGGPGSLDLTFNPGAGANNAVFALARQADCKILVGGQFTQFNGAEQVGLVRLHPDGSLDAGYNPVLAGSGYVGVAAIALQADGKALIGGGFASVNGVARANIARLRTNGSLDTTFNPGAGVTGPGPYLNAIVLQPDGKALIGGYFTGYNGSKRNMLVRLTTAGALDTTFDAGSGPNLDVAAIAIQPAGSKVLIGGNFAAVNGAPHECLARLNANGSLDATFNPTADNEVDAIAVQPDGKILIGGRFTEINSVARSYIARLNANGSLDATFLVTLDKPVASLALQPDGRIVIGGQFTTVGVVPRKRIARLNADGSLDAGFDPGDGADYTVFAMTLAPDGRILIGGGFQYVNRVARQHVARLWGDPRIHLPLLYRR